MKKKAGGTRKGVKNYGRMILVMPVFNEIDVIEEVVKDNFKYISKFPNANLLVSEDGSNDGTAELLKKLQKKLGFILHSSKKRKGAAQGQRDALAAALKEKADTILITDSDNQHDPKDFDKLLALYDDADMVNGVKTNRQDPSDRVYGSKLWNMFVNMMFGMNLHDVNTGFRVMRRKLVEEILPVNTLFPECVLSETSIRAKYAGYRIKEANVSHRKRETEARAWNPKKIPSIGLTLFKKAFELKKDLRLVAERKVRDPKLMDKTYSSYYSDEYSFRSDWFGPIAQEYIIPKYFKLLDSFIEEKDEKIKILEIGAGDGEVTDYIRKHRPNWHIVPTEPLKAAVTSLQKKGYKDAALVSATEIPFKDNAFDYSICFDVMHHVEGPAQMGYEMTRVAKKGVFLIEANRASITRRLLEKTQTYIQAGEFSYYPVEYKAFFNLPSVRKVTITPFQFIPPKLSNIHLGLAIALSEFVAMLPILRWQCSGAAIKVWKKAK